MISFKTEHAEIKQLIDGWEATCQQETLAIPERGKSSPYKRSTYYIKWLAAHWVVLEAKSQGDTKKDRQ